LLVARAREREPERERESAVRAREDAAVDAAANLNVEAWCASQSEYCTPTI
jgi:hypothetical protein